MTSLAPSIDGGGIGPLVTPADLASSVAAGNNSASLQSQDSYTVTIDNLPVSLFRKYAFTFSYIYSDPSGPIDGPRSATYFVEYTPPNECTEPTNVTVTQGIGSYGIKWDKPTFGTYVDTIIYESPNGSFDSTSKIVYIGTANQCTVLTGTDYSQRFIKIYYRDKYLHQSPIGTVAGPISGKNSDPDTSTAPSAPSLGLPVSFLDADDKSGFSAGVTINWSPNSGTNTAGYVIRWSTQNPAVITNPLWEYGQVEGQSSSSFTVKGLIPNTLYYYQVTSKSPYNAISWTSPQSGTFGPVVDPTAPSDVWAQLKSILSIGGKTADLFKIGTGITQPINNSITTTPTMTASLPWSGIILNKSTTDQGNNYWLNTGQFRVGNSSSFLYWDGSNIYTTGRINATGGSFSGDIQLSTGSLYTGSTPNSGARVRFNSGGIYAYDSTSTNSSTGNTFTLDAATGLISAQKGSISGWTIDGTKFSQNGAVIDSAGKISLGTTANASVYLSATDPTYRIWVGNNNGANASFSVDSAGILRATGAIISGSISIGSTLSDGTSLTDVKNGSSAGASALQPNGTLTGSVAGTATINGTTASTVVTNAAKSGTAVQPGNGLTVDSTTKIINGLQASSGMKISSGGTKPVYMDNTGLYMTGSSGLYSIFLDASTGDAVFRGTVYATNGDFASTLTGAVIKTAASGQRITMNETSNFINFYPSDSSYSPGTIGMQNTLMRILGPSGPGQTASNIDMYGGSSTSYIDLQADQIKVGILSTSSLISTGSIGTSVNSGSAFDTRTGAFLSNSGYIIARRASGVPLFSHRTDSNGAVVQFYFSGVSGGSIVGSTTATPSFSGTSDYRAKKNIEDYAGALNKLNLTKPKSFIMKNDENEKTQVNFIAHEFAEVFPEFVFGEKDAVDSDGNPEYQTITTTNLIPYLVAAIKELSQKVDDLSK